MGIVDERLDHTLEAEEGGVGFRTVVQRIVNQKTYGHSDTLQTMM